LSYFQNPPATTSRARGPRGKLTQDPIEEEVESVKGYSDFVNGALCFFVGVLWVAVCQLMSNKSVGVAIIFLPFGVLALAGTYLIARFRVKNLH